MSSSQYCTHCGGKLKTGAKFCTICGTRQTRNMPSQQSTNVSSQRSTNVSSQPTRNTFSNPTRNNPPRQTSRAPVQPTGYTSRSSGSPSSYSSRFSPKDDSIVNSNAEKNSTQGFTLTTMLALESEIDELTKTVSLTENQAQSLAIYNTKITETTKISVQIEEILGSQTTILEFVQTIKWTEMKDYRSRYNVGGNFQELDYVILTAHRSILQASLTGLNQSLATEKANTDVTSSKSTLKQKQQALENNHQKWLRGITNFRQYSRALTNLSYYESKSIEQENNLLILDKVHNKIETIQDILTNLKMDTEYSIASYFSYSQVLSSFEEDNFQSLINKCASLNDLVADISYYLDQVKYKESISLYSKIGSTIMESILKNYFASDSFASSVSVIENAQNHFTHLTNQIKNISNEITNSHQSILSDISSLRDLILKMRQEYLMTGKLKTNYSASPILPEVEKQSINVDENVGLGLKSESLTNIDSGNVFFKGISLQDAVNRHKDRKEEQKSTTVKDQDIYDSFESNMNENMFKITMPKLPKLSSMNSSYLDSEEVNEVEKKLKEINYLFKRLSFYSDFKAEGSYYTGAIKEVVFDYPKNEPLMTITAQLKLDIDKDIHFILQQESSRKPYSWEQPYAGVQLSEASDDILKKILRERRIAEKFNKIPGKVLANINLETIVLQLDNRKDVIEPAVEFLNEISFIINLSFRF